MEPLKKTDCFFQSLRSFESFLAKPAELLKKRALFFKSSPAMALLRDEDLLSEVTGRSWGRIYLARPILQAIEDGA
jgi:hypothetical protein